MIVAFWSGTGRNVGLTTNLACIAAYYALRYHRKLMLFENHLPKERGLEKAILPPKDFWSGVREEPFYYDSQGMEQLLKILQAGYEPEAIEEIAVSLLDGKLNYLPLSEQMGTSVYEYELNRVMERLLKELEARSDLVLVDTQSAGNLSTKLILEQAGLVVVNLCQEPPQLGEFLEAYKNLTCKCIFLLGHYQEEHVYNRINLSRIYGIPENKIYVVPEYPLLPYLGTQGRIPDFIKRNLWSSPGERNYGLMREIRRAAERIREFAEGGKTEKFEKADI